MALLEKDIVVKTSTIPGSGQGLFSKVAISKGTKIVEYKGRISTWKEVRHDNGENGYIYFLNRNHVIDASKAKAALSRYANDAAGLTRVKGLFNNAEYIEDGKRVYIVAKKDIAPGEEIFVGYGKEYWQTIRHNIRVEQQRKKEAEKKSADQERKEALRAKKAEDRKQLAARKKAKRAALAAGRKARKTEAAARQKAKRAEVAARKKARQMELAAGRKAKRAELAARKKTSRK